MNRSDMHAPDHWHQKAKELHEMDCPDLNQPYGCTEYCKKQKEATATALHEAYMEGRREIKESISDALCEYDTSSEALDSISVGNEE